MGKSFLSRSAQLMYNMLYSRSHLGLVKVLVTLRRRKKKRKKIKPSFRKVRQRKQPFTNSYYLLLGRGVEQQLVAIGKAEDHFQNQLTAKLIWMRRRVKIQHFLVRCQTTTQKGKNVVSTYLPHWCRGKSRPNELEMLKAMDQGPTS